MQKAVVDCASSLNEETDVAEYDSQA